MMREAEVGSILQREEEARPRVRVVESGDDMRFGGDEGGDTVAVVDGGGSMVRGLEW